MLFRIVILYLQPVNPTAMSIMPSTNKKAFFISYLIYIEFLLARHNPGLGQPLLKGLQTFVIFSKRL